MPRLLRRGQVLLPIPGIDVNYSLYSVGGSARIVVSRLAQAKREKARGYESTATFRRGLPAWGYRDTIVSMMRDHQVHGNN